MFLLLFHSGTDICVVVTVSIRHRKTCVWLSQEDMCVVDMWAMDVSPLAVEASEERLIEGDAGNSRKSA